MSDFDTLINQIRNEGFLAMSTPFDNASIELIRKQKLDILNKLDNKVSTIAAVCDKYGMHCNAVGRWKKNWDNIRKQVEEE